MGDKYISRASNIYYFDDFFAGDLRKANVR